MIFDMLRLLRQFLICCANCVSSLSVGINKPHLQLPFFTTSTSALIPFHRRNKGHLIIHNWKAKDVKGQKVHTFLPSHVSQNKHSVINTNLCWTGATYLFCLRLQASSSFIRTNRIRKLKNERNIGKNGLLHVTPSLTHWSVKCIFATPNKQDNVDSESEVVLKYIWIMTMAMRGLPDYSWNLLLT